jgi:hypothetical protein
MLHEVTKKIGIVLCSGATFVALAIPANAQEDTTPPKLQALSLSTNMIDTSGGPQVVTATATITDDLSGVASAQLYFEAPSGSANVGASLMLVSGDTYVGDLTFSQFAPQGIWTIAAVSLQDNAGNSRFESNADLLQRGINVVVGNGSFETTYSRQISRLNYGKTLVNANVSAEGKACEAGPAKLQRKRSTGWDTVQKTWIEFGTARFKHASLKTGAKYRVYVPSFGLGTPVLATCGKASQKFTAGS